ncbi:hypothetical protein [Pedobacter sp. SG908]|uniref:hypothetical protein n=1 Tax=Pedobacter sp. SG908 TaxID=2587135 RepID=UPI001420FBA7|nr:hypothetical protein [Pedobacter sp. SG908]NII84764.1 hypothetical protein [Pedobacter sp. SG908]
MEITKANKRLRFTAFLTLCSNFLACSSSFDQLSIPNQIIPGNMRDPPKTQQLAIKHFKIQLSFTQNSIISPIFSLNYS